MILPPINDQECLGAITDIARSVVAARDPAVIARARALGTVENVIRSIRARPQRDDNGAPHDLPKVAACAPPQRVRLFPDDPNCVERTLWFLILAEILVPGRYRCMTTIDLPDGRGGTVRHTLPIENGRAVILNPQVPRNAACAAVDAACGIAPPSDPGAGADWLCRLAAEPAQLVVGGPRAVRNAAVTMRTAAPGAAIPAPLLDDVAFVLALAEREAARWGDAGIAVVDRVTRRLAGSDRGADRSRPSASGPSAPPASLRNAIRLAIGRYRLRPDLVRGLRIAAHAAAGVAPAVAGPAARLALASVGITPAMLAPLEIALRRDGLSLGPLVSAAPA